MGRQITSKITRKTDGRWCKRVDGQLYYWNDEQTARNAVIEWMRSRAAGGNGIPTVPVTPTDPLLRDIANLFYAHLKDRGIRPKTLADYKRSIDGFLAHAGKLRTAASLAPADFAKVRADWTTTLGPWKLSTRVQCIRTMFRWAEIKARLIARQPWYGDAFPQASKAEKMRVKRDRERDGRERKFSMSEVRAILANAKRPLRTFVLLALNGGMYAADIAALAPGDVKAEGRNMVIDTFREKTSVRQKFVLWPETWAAIQKTRSQVSASHLFTTIFGNPWVQGNTDSIGQRFRKLLKDLGIHRQDVGFGSFRHTHISAVGSNPDAGARHYVRGHLIRGIEGTYDTPDIQRLKSVTDLARQRFLLTKSARQTPAGETRKRSASARQRRRTPVHSA
jgi:integrase